MELDQTKYWIHSRSSGKLLLWIWCLQSNVIPQSASALVNHRIHPGQTLQEVIRHDFSVMEESSVNISVQSFYPPMKISPYGPLVPQYVLIAKSIKQIYPDSIVAPGTYYCCSLHLNQLIALWSWINYPNFRHNIIQHVLPPTRTCSSTKTYQSTSTVLLQMS